MHFSPFPTFLNKVPLLQAFNYQASELHQNIYFKLLSDKGLKIQQIFFLFQLLKLRFNLVRLFYFSTLPTSLYH